MSTRNGTVARLVALAILALAAMGRPSPLASQGAGPCNTYCWHACNTIQGEWCGSGCGNLGITCSPNGICGSYDLVTVSCFAPEPQ